MRLANGQELLIEVLSSRHERKNFDCGQVVLNRYIRESAKQHSKKHIGRTYVGVVADNPQIIGYYTVCTGSISFKNLPAGVGNLPQYPIPTLHLARLAIDNAVQGQGLGRILLFEVLKLAAELSAKVGIYAVDVIAIDEAARQFYIRHGFTPLIDDNRHLILPVKDILDLELI